jgi:toxin ParE1/3/4
VKRFVQLAARVDMRRQYEHYLELDRPDLGDRFFNAVNGAVDAALENPDAGAPRRTINPQLAGLRTWSVAGFNDFRVYYLVRGGSLIVVRVLHGKRDIDAILKDQVVQDPDAD